MGELIQASPETRMNTSIPRFVRLHLDDRLRKERSGVSGGAWQAPGRRAARQPCTRTRTDYSVISGWKRSMVDCMSQSSFTKATRNSLPVAVH